MQILRYAAVAVMAFALAGTTLMTTGCASTSTQASLGENIDDGVITTKLKALFVEDKTVDATNIKVETYKGTVQLSGFAKSDVEIRRAVEIARSVQGVKDVKNDIRLRAAVK